MSVFIDSRRQKTMYKRIGRAQEIIPEGFQWLPLVRNRQNQLTDDEWNTLVDFAKTAEKPQNALMKMLAKTRWGNTIKYLRRAMNRPREIVEFIKKNLSEKGEKYANFVADFSRKNGLSLANIVNFYEISRNKREPDKYFGGCLKSVK